jgi:hypothetical protein
MSTHAFLRAASRVRARWLRDGESVGGDDECDAADRGGEDARSSLTRSIEKTLYGVQLRLPGLIA